MIRNTIETISDERSLLTEEIIDGYNIFSGGLSMAPYYFIYYMAQKTEKTLTKKFNEYKKYIQFYKLWKKWETRLKKISGKFTSAKDIIAKDNVLVYLFFIISSLLLIPSVFSINLLSLLNEILMLLTGLPLAYYLLL
jgi:hypothetical protein